MEDNGAKALPPSTRKGDQTVSEQQGVSLQPETIPKYVCREKCLPSRSEQPPNDINVVVKPAPLDYQTPSEDRERK
jgi:hypothetical protein